MEMVKDGEIIRGAKNYFVSLGFPTIRYEIKKSDVHKNGHCSQPSKIFSPIRTLLILGTFNAALLSIDV
jgi:hypothetical protein